MGHKLPAPSITRQNTTTVTSLVTKIVHQNLPIRLDVHLQVYVPCSSQTMLLQRVFFVSKNAVLRRFLKRLQIDVFELVVEPPIWKICLWNWIISLGRDVNKKCLSCHHLVLVVPKILITLMCPSKWLNVAIIIMTGQPPPLTYPRNKGLIRLY